MTVSFEISDVFTASPPALYEAWLDSEAHSEMTGGKAEVNDIEIAPFNAWGGYIQGVNLELEPGKRILQKWRTTEFGEEDADSLLEILFEAEGENTRVTIRHSNLPENGMQYKQGWVDAYFTPMHGYFTKE